MTDMIPRPYVPADIAAWARWFLDEDGPRHERNPGFNYGNLALLIRSLLPEEATPPMGLGSTYPQVGEWTKWGPMRWFREKKGPDGRVWYVWASDDRCLELEAELQAQNPPDPTLF